MRSARALLGLLAPLLLLDTSRPLAAQTLVIGLGDSARVIAPPGTRVAVPVRADLSLAAGTSLASLQAQLRWPSTRLLFDSLRAPSGWTATINQDSSATGMIVFSSFSANALPASGPLATAYFTAASTSSAAGGARLTLAPTAAGGDDGWSVLASVQTRALDVCVSPYLNKWGDVTDDGTVNVIDAQQIARHSVGLSVANPTAILQRGDVTGDNQINVIDAQQVARFSVGLSANARINTGSVTIPTASSLTMVPPARTDLATGTGLQLAADPRDATGASLAGCPAISWSSSAPTVATVSSSGLVTGVSTGTVTITATSGAVSTSVLLTVSAPPVAGESLVTGLRHACALTPAGKAYCWGHNVNFHVGDGTNVARAQPVAVSTDLTFQALSAGDWHTCGLTPARALYCWGAGWNGRNGDGTTASRSTPTRVNTLLSFGRVAAGQEFTCALTEAGVAHCWGANHSGQLGDGTTAERRTPVPVQGGLTFRSLSAGYRHVCGVTTSGTTYCWGNNDDGYLGDGTRTSRLTPNLVSGSLQFSDLAVGTYHTCGRTTTGAAFCWGSGGNGELGTGVNVSFYVPTPVIGGHTWRQLSAGNATTCGVTTGFVLYCWGRNIAGQVGDGTRETRFAPVPVLTGVSEVSVGLDMNVCATLLSGAVSCWGLNNDGALGRGFDRVLTPTVVAGAPGFTTLASNYGAPSMCGVTSAGAVRCWGYNNIDAFGASTANQINETPVGGGQGLTLRNLSGGAYHACGTTAANQAYCWGANWYGTHGSGNGNWTGNTPVAVTGGLAFSKVDAGVDHSCGITTTGQGYCWGRGDNGAIGDGSTSGNMLSPSAVSGGLTWTDITSGSGHSCAVAVGGAAYCWGLNNLGQLGNGTTSNSSTPTLVSGGLTFSRVEAGLSFTCGLLVDGRVACWGHGADGRLGNGATTTRTTPTLISSTLSFTKLEVMWERACALTAAGELYCWGLNHSGQLGTENTISALSPVRIGTRSYVAITGTTGTTCAVGTDTQTYCWGDNAFGQAGQRQTLTPQPVLGGLTFRTP
jgi:alpha-tubulin suppressor-like RCC1 family protein